MSKSKYIYLYVTNSIYLNKYSSDIREKKNKNWGYVKKAFKSERGFIKELKKEGKEELYDRVFEQLQKGHVWKTHFKGKEVSKEKFDKLAIPAVLLDKRVYRIIHESVLLLI